MKFGEELNMKIHKPWQHLYVQYNELSGKLERKSQSEWTEQDERDFLMTFQQELSKVYNFVNGCMIELTHRVEQTENKINDLKSQQQQQQHWMNKYDTLADILTEILFDINDISKYHQLNTTALDKLAKQHDKQTQLDLCTKYHGTLLTKWPLDKIHFDVLIVRISNMQDICRLQGHPRPKQAYSQGEDQTAFERATAKYWIHPDNITEVKSIILMYLPIHVFNQRKPYEQSDAAVSSVYFDNPNYDLYSERLQREEGAEAIRFRWYGQSTNDIYVERKTHHAPWLNGNSVKDRFRLKDTQINAFIQGRYTPDDLIKDLRAKAKLDNDAIEQNAFIARGIQHSIQHRHLKPMCRVFYNRTAFQLPGDQRLRISLDHNLTFIREDHLDGHPRRRTYVNGVEQEQWRRLDVGVDYPFRHISPSSDILRFPYAVLETKLQHHLGQETPPWLEKLLSSHLVHEVPRFSKYLHGASQLYKDSVPILPWWISELEKDIRKQPMANIGLSRSLSLKPLFNGHHRRSLDQQQQQKNVPYIAINLSDPTQPSEKHSTGRRDLISRLWAGRGLSYNHSKKASGLPRLEDDEEKTMARQRLPRLVAQAKKMDPKAFFANERTFISWLQFCALILTVALNLLNYGDHISRFVGAIFIILASLISIYALIRFQIRAYQMRTGRHLLRIDDIYGPAVLCILLVSALVINFYLRAPLLAQSDDSG
ncbi:VTC domain-containing protein [Halteromyces radiatus]|uniref:VTC domain-containing protein n=1 Tax=Halteromyces radiatus TaxID=101107 RepID=UPI00221EF546|nr:VTC domain-containing protein [Halteromyces radiatus]KAI8082921.1 VTC domain-containing protein [Halteromyces radiatus]